MRILLARHGHAVPENRFLPDEYRYLSARGREQVSGVGDVLRGEGVTIDAVLTSPLCRAVQTAELVAAALDYRGLCESDVSLLPGSLPQVATQTIQSRAASLQSLLVVGHMPGISALGARLVGNPGFPGLKPGHVMVLVDGAAAFKVDPDRLEIEQFLID